MAAHLPRNLTTFAIGEGLSGFGQNLVSPMVVLVVLLHAHGAPAPMIGALMTIQLGASMLPQALGVYLFRSTRRRKVHLALWYMLTCSPMFLVMAAIAYWSQALGDGATRWGLIGSFLVMCLAGGTAASVWMDWIAHLFEQRVRGRAFGLMHGVSNLTAAGAAVIAGKVLDEVPASHSYALLYLSAGLILMAACGVYLTARDPAQHAEEVLTRTGFGEMLTLFGRSLHQRNFRGFLIGRLLAILGFSILPFIVIHYSGAQGGGLAEPRVVQFSAGQWIASSVALLGAGWLGDRLGHRCGLLLSTSAQIVVLLLLLSTAGVWSCIAVYALVGIWEGANRTAHYNLLCETCPHDNRKAHLTVGNLALPPAAAGAPLLAGWVSYAHGFAVLIWASLAVSAAAFLWFLLALKEPRTVPPLPE